VNFGGESTHAKQLEKKRFVGRMCEDSDGQFGNLIRVPHLSEGAIDSSQESELVRTM
jgi:hypothetical protein